MDPSNSQYQAMMNTHSSLQNVTIMDCSASNSKKQQQTDQKTQRPQPEALKCPRCDSSNTKFCYYNNYSLTQPRYFCKACRRYWTKGGSLRNVPVGGGVRKNHNIKRSSSSSSSSSSKVMRSSTQSDHDQQVLMITNNNNSINPLLFNLPNISSSSTYDTNDLTLAFGRLHKQQTHPTSCRQLGFDDNGNSTTTTTTISTSIYGNPRTTHFDILGNPNTSGFIDPLRSGFDHNLYNSYGNMGEVENGDQEMGLPYEEINSGILASTPKEEFVIKSDYQGRDNINGDQNRILWNFPWQLQFGHDQEGSAGRDINQCWNNGSSSSSSLGSSWHGLVNTTL